MHELRPSNPVNVCHDAANAPASVEIEMLEGTRLLVGYLVNGAATTGGGFASLECGDAAGGHYVPYPSAADTINNIKTARQTASYGCIFSGCSRFVKLSTNWTAQAGVTATIWYEVLP